MDDYNETPLSFLNKIPDIDNKVYIHGQKYVERVTTILEKTINEEWLMQWAYAMGLKHTSFNTIKQDAANVGTYAHDAIQNFMTNNISLNLDTVKPQYVNAVNYTYQSFLLWWNNLIQHHTVKIILQEEKLVCKYFGGTLDLLLDIDGKVYLIDFKTSNQLSFKYFLQLSAYRYMLREERGIIIDGCGIVKLSKKCINCDDIFANFSDIEDLTFINMCEDTFLSLTLSYYNTVNIQVLYKDFERRYNTNEFSICQSD